MMQFQLIDSIHQISAQQWDQLFCRGGNLTATSVAYPFVKHDFLAALEDSGCTSRDSGWEPKHLLVFDSEQPETLLAAMPLFLKHHSYGEYVFDWAWADAYRRNAMDYYPKLLSAAPFTPATGPRLATEPEIDRRQIIIKISDFLSNYCEQHQLSSWHLLFLDNSDTHLWHEAGSLTRVGCQFHWYNQEYRDFDDFLSRFNSRKRKSVRKERRQVTEQGVSLTRLVGDQISDDDWHLFYQFYHTTYLKRSGGGGYLNRAFFEAIARSMGEQILMVKAEQEGEGTIACALCFFDDSHLYGRYWGCRVEVPGLHFEACYYQGIEFAIEQKLQIFDPGAQGEHKIQRGFEPTLTYSQHHLTDTRFHHAVDNFLQQETPGVKEYQRDCANYLPFKNEQ
ncbi:MAG: GNAT family N-acetyltransferase [Cellvibrionaceae bacterium]